MGELKWQHREQLPDILNSMGLVGVGVEVGTQKGLFAEHLRRHWNGQMLLCVDHWAQWSHGPAATHEYQRNAITQTALRLHETGKRFSLWCMPSAEAAHYMRTAGLESRLDFVYLDADHAYESVKADIAAWWPLVKPGGIFAGHDYVPDGWHRPDQPVIAYPSKEEGGPMSVPFGVIRAVDEFAKTAGVDISLTAPGDCGGWRSWGVVKHA